MISSRALVLTLAHPQILDIVSTSLKHVAEHELTGQARHAKSATDEALREAENLAFAERLKRVGYHDPRLDSIAGNGIMSELGGFSPEPLPHVDVRLF